MVRRTISERVFSALIKHKGEWRTSAEIAGEAGCTADMSQLPVRTAVRGLITDGVPIVSSQWGYRIAVSDAEIKIALDALRTRADEIQHRADLLMDAWELWNSVEGL